LSPILTNLALEIGELRPKAYERKNRYVNSVIGLMTKPGRLISARTRFSPTTYGALIFTEYVRSTATARSPKAIDSMLLMSLGIMERTIAEPLMDWTPAGVVSLISCGVVFFIGEASDSFRHGQ